MDPITKVESTTPSMMLGQSNAEVPLVQIQQEALRCLAEQRVLADSKLQTQAERRNDTMYQTFIPTQPIIGAAIPKYQLNLCG